MCLMLPFPLMMGRGLQPVRPVLDIFWEIPAMKKGHITFVIGGSLGLHESVKRRADKCVSFGRITLPHQLMRVVMTEQIYRAFKINNKETYHK